MSTWRLTPAAKRRSQEIFESLDQRAVVAAVRNTDYTLGDWDWQTVGEMIHALAEKYLSRDVEWLELSAIEHRFEAEGESGVYDQVGKFTANAPDYLRGKTFVRDWKTTKGELDETWVARYTNSWQWRVYLYNSSAEVFVYTGVGKNGGTREIHLLRPLDLEVQVRTQLMGLGTMGEGLVAIGAEVYPMNRPWACYAFGRRCENYEECGNYTMPRKLLETWNWSPTSMDQFLLCPERFRRERLRREKEGEGTTGYEAEIGKAVHRGLAEIYRQVYRR